jgi:hypothetical protein
MDAATAVEAIAITNSLRRPRKHPASMQAF